MGKGESETERTKSARRCGNEELGNKTRKKTTNTREQWATKLEEMMEPCLSTTYTHTHWLSHGQWGGKTGGLNCLTNGVSIRQFKVSPAFPVKAQIFFYDRDFLWSISYLLRSFFFGKEASPGLTNCLGDGPVSEPEK